VILVLYSIVPCYFLTTGTREESPSTKTRKKIFRRSNSWDIKNIEIEKNRIKMPNLLKSYGKVNCVIVANEIFIRYDLIS
jgi:hypothetical protein